jgi:transcriptional regulator with XRE-family HTH domain
MKTLARPALRRPPQPEPDPRFWLGVNLHSLRKKKGLTQEALAKLADISARRLRDIENAVPESNPQLNTLSALAEALDVDIAVFFKHLPASELIEV